MSSREDPDAVAKRRARERVGRAIEEIHRARVGAGMSQQALGDQVTVSRSRVSRIERDLERQVPAVLLVRLAAAVGLDLAIRAYPGGDPTLDAPQRRVLARAWGRLGPDWAWRTEVLLEIAGDLRAWDAVGRHAMTGLVVHMEAETRLGDVQGLLRRIARKRRDALAARCVLVVSDTRHNREVVAAAPEIRASFPVSPRLAWSMLMVGRDPGGDAVLLV